MLYGRLYGTKDNAHNSTRPAAMRQARPKDRFWLPFSDGPGQSAPLSSWVYFMDGKDLTMVTSSRKVPRSTKLQLRFGTSRLAPI